MRVLYLDSDGPLGGASRSLFEVVRPLSAGDVDPYFVAVQGTALDFYSQIARDTVVTRGLTKFDNTRYSYYRGVRWLILIRGSISLSPSSPCCARACAGRLSISST